MASDRNKKKKDVPDLTIFEERKAQKLSAKEVLKTAKDQEALKLKEGYRYLASPDGKTMILTKTKK